MPIFIYGINHKKSPLSLREQWSFDALQVRSTLRSIKSSRKISETLILSTCNRTEIYAHEKDSTALYSWLKKEYVHQYKTLIPYAYHHRGLKALQHAIRVSSGLDSMLTGEAHILGQMKQAYRLACEMGTVGHCLQQTFPAIFSASKVIRHKTNIAEYAVSLTYLILKIARQHFSPLPNARILLIGSGKMTTLIAAHLRKKTKCDFIIAGRNFEKIRQLAYTHKAQGITLSEIPQYLQFSDIIISATSSPSFILNFDVSKKALLEKKQNFTLMIDLSVPRNIDPKLSQIKNTCLYNIDDLQRLIQENTKSKKTAIKQAEQMVQSMALHYFKQFRVLHASDIITRYRKKVESLRDEALQKACIELEKGDTPEIVLSKMARNLSNKLMHFPTQKLRQAAYQNQNDVLLLAKELLNL